MKTLHPVLFKLLICWLALMGLQSLGRLYFFYDFLPAGFFDTTSFSEILFAFLMALRQDSSIATLFLLPFILYSVLLLHPKFPQKLWHTPFRYWAVLVGVATVITVLSKHMFFYYYKDLFNTFFWEFWLNWENSKLVIWSFFDELPVTKIILVSFLLLLFYFGFRFLLERKILPHVRGQWFGKKAWLVLWVLLIPLSIRGTFDVLPLTLQQGKGLISKSNYLVYTNGNPLYALYNSWDKNFRTSVALKSKALDPNQRANFEIQFDILKRLDQNRELITNDDGQPMLRYRVESLAGDFLHKKPRHVVVLFMESFFSWPSLYDEDPGFQQKVSSNFLGLKKKGLYFDHYFQAGAGTIQNLTKAVLGIPTPRDFPNDNTFTDGFKGFPGTMPRVFESEGYHSCFYYGGSLAWHNLGYFMQRAGFDEVFGENAVQNADKHRFGLNDADLFKLLDKKLNEADQPTFNFVMTLSNHPPYQLPDDYVSEIEEPPVGLVDLVKDRALFKSRFRAYSYSDKALGAFFEQAKNKEYFKDTLFIITADHTVHAPFDWPAENEYKIAKIPLLLYAPNLLKPPPGPIQTKGTHFDLVPTILSLVAQKPMFIEHWGKNLLAPVEDDSLFSFYFDCFKDLCRFQKENYRLDEQERFVACEDSSCLDDEKRLVGHRTSFDLSGMYYFLTFQDQTQPQKLAKALAE